MPLRKQVGLFALREATGKVGGTLKVILVLIVPTVKSNAKSLCNRRRVHSGRNGCIVELVCVRVPEFYVITKTRAGRSTVRSRRLRPNVREFQNWSMPLKKSCSSIAGRRFNRSGPRARSNASKIVVLPVLLSPMRTPCVGKNNFAC